MKKIKNVLGLALYLVLSINHAFAEGSSVRGGGDSGGGSDSGFTRPTSLDSTVSLRPTNDGGYHVTTVIVEGLTAEYLFHEMAKTIKPTHNSSRSGINNSEIHENSIVEGKRIHCLHTLHTSKRDQSFRDESYKCHSYLDLDTGDYTATGY